jgi:hypothetical protein
MATRINPVRVNQTGVPSGSGVPADVAAGNVIANSESVKLTVDNSAGGSPLTVTLKTSATVEGYAVADVTVTVPANSKREFGRFSRALFGSDVEFSCSAACTLYVYQ